MRRWHSEMELMRRRWRIELAKHTDLPPFTLAPPSCAVDIDCHCAHGIGSVRKKKPYDCGNPRCGCCHSEKFGRKRRAERKRQAIEFELRQAS